MGRRRSPKNKRVGFISTRLAGTDGLGDPGFNIDNLRELLYQATNYTAQLTVDEVVATCQAVDDWSRDIEGIALGE